MDFLRCTIKFDEILRDIYSTDTAIRVIEENIDNVDFLEGTIVVKTLSGQASFWFGNMEAMLESLMNL
jgi:hypothetical protein